MIKLIDYAALAVLVMLPMVASAEQPQPSQEQLQIQMAYDEAAKSQGLEIFNLKATIHVLRSQLKDAQEKLSALKAELAELKKNEPKPE